VSRREDTTWPLKPLGGPLNAWTSSLLWGLEHDGRIS